jgi:hypothetical protein
LRASTTIHKGEHTLTRAGILGLAAGFVLAFTGCSSLTIDHVDYAWPIESALTVGPDNRVSEGRYALSFSVAPIAMEEFLDSTALRGSTVRVIRNSEGHYFVTGQRFRHVYVLAPGPAQLFLVTAIEVAPTGLRSPALNQRGPYVELVDSGTRKMLTSDGIAENQP